MCTLRSAAVSCEAAEGGRAAWSAVIASILLPLTRAQGVGGEVSHGEVSGQAILLSLNALASTSLAQSPADDPNYRGNDPEGAVTTSKLQIHVSTYMSKIYS